MGSRLASTLFSLRDVTALYMSGPTLFSDQRCELDVSFLPFVLWVHTLTLLLDQHRGRPKGAPTADNMLARRTSLATQKERE